jgi:ankyrin repeat protein
MTMSNSKPLNSVYVLLGLILDNDWKMIRTLIAVSSPDYFRGMTVSMHKLNGMTFLHAIVRDNPPLDIVGNIIKLCPEMAAARDGLGRTPLHIAAGSKVSPLLLKLIARAYPAACDAQDEDGRTPLHFVCDTSFVLFSDNDPSQKASQHEAVVALLSESSYASTIEDADEMSPLEHAIMCGASLKTVQLLQASATKSLQSRARSASPNPGPGANKRRRVSSTYEDVHINDNDAA